MLRFVFLSCVFLDIAQFIEKKLLEQKYINQV